MLPVAPPPVDPDEARARLLEELAKSEYDDSPGFVEWLLGALESWLAGVLEGIDGSSTAQAGVAVLLLIGLAAAVVLVLRRAGLLRRSHALSVQAQLDADEVLSASQLRRAAREASEAGRADDATVLALRALVRDLEERTLLEVSAGMTAHEAALRAAAPFPELRGRLLRAADAFDTAAYSHRHATPKQAEDLLRLAEYLTETSPDLSAAERAENAGRAEADPVHRPPLGASA
ncbi:DUF4129 domain-containing protein [Brachybacterium saurashtrense]|uniref:DUF4129 domain-containing protein n=1 Tax=Brachybacterium saurashtrense TaxID=556288 RepID=A0A345YNM1_9MICO|nr:DUF4129 domain-containing protein [Brachybacterium saurashtrense]AXK45523.1 DUF4129 domain-containing protein [Brachybacterium saurashtrense]RRR21106.1 DUF4129 domain-containing protein [Brachybacterium saurashtrense]